MTNSSTINIKKRNYFVSYLRWIALIFIIIIHLIEWWWFTLTHNQSLIKELFTFWSLFFVTLIWSIVIIAYWKSDDRRKSWKKIMYRAIKLMWVYYLVNILKLFLYDFSKESFYSWIIWAWKMNVISILTLKWYSMPISILATMAMLMLLSPIILFIYKKCKYNYAIILALIFIFVILSSLNLPSNLITDILYSKNLISFPIALRIIPYLIGVFVAMIWFEKKRISILIWFWLLTILCLFYLKLSWNVFYVSRYMYPLKIYYIISWIFTMFLFVNILYYLEKIKNKIIDIALWVLALLWDKSFSLYIWHWIIIDLVYYFTSNIKLIVYYVISYLIWYIFLQYYILNKHK